MFRMNENILLYDDQGNRLYLTDEERAAFLDAARKAPRQVRTFCAILHFTGCRLSEALALTPRCVDLADGTVRFETLKKRRKGVYRAVPVPPDFWIPWTWFTASVRRRGVQIAMIWINHCGPGPGRRPGDGYQRL